MAPLYDRTCERCGHVHTGTRAELTRLVSCAACGEGLPPGMQVHAERGAGAAGAGSPAAPPADARPSAAWTRACPSCAHVHEGEREALLALRYCEACGDFLAGSDVLPAGGRPACASDVAAPAPAPAARPEAGGLALRLADADVTEPLPDAPGAGVFGRLTAAHPTLASLSTLSRRQFAYSERDDGSVEIRNLSRFGTVAAGRRLSAEGDAAVVAPPAVIEMAGLTFILERAGA